MTTCSDTCMLQRNWSHSKHMSVFSEAFPCVGRLYPADKCVARVCVVDSRSWETCVVYSIQLQYMTFTVATTQCMATRYIDTQS